MYVTRYVVTMTTDGSGDATGYTGHATGHVQAIRYVPDGTAPFDTGFDATITCDVSALPVVTITNGGTSALSLYPRAATVSVANAALLYAAGGTAVTDRIPVAGERIKIVIAQGGDTKVGVFHVYVG